MTTYKHDGIADFMCRNEGTLWLLMPRTQAAREWVIEHLPPHATTWGDSIVVEHRYMSDILEGIRRDKLRVEAT